jgi:hypothetical protein
MSSLYILLERKKVPKQPVKKKKSRAIRFFGAKILVGHKKMDSHLGKIAK